MPLNKRREPLRMADVDRDTPLRLAAFEHVRRLGETHDHLTATELKPGFAFEGERFPLMNPQRGIFKPQQMRFLLSIKTVFPRPGTRVWYDDQREVHRQIFEADETIDYAFMGQDPGAADNRWLREAAQSAACPKPTPRLRHLAASRLRLSRCKVYVARPLTFAIVRPAPLPESPSTPHTI